MATFVLVHGGGHGGWCWQKLARRLRAAGHEVHCPTLTGLGERAHLLHPGIDLESHIADVCALLHYEDLTQVYLAGHSYGGMVVTGVADRALERISHLIFLDAAQPRDGEALVTLSPALIQMAHAQARTVDGVELVLFPDSDAVAIYGVNDPADAAWMAPRLTPHPWACFTQPLTMTRQDQVLALPRTSVNCTHTLSVRSQQYLDRALSARHLFEIDTGHDLMITEPEQIAAMLLEVVRREEV